MHAHIRVKYSHGRVVLLRGDNSLEDADQDWFDSRGNRVFTVCRTLLFNFDVCRWRFWKPSPSISIRTNCHVSYQFGNFLVCVYTCGRGLYCIRTLSKKAKITPHKGSARPNFLFSTLRPRRDGQDDYNRGSEPVPCQGLFSSVFGRMDIEATSLPLREETISDSTRTR